MKMMNVPVRGSSALKSHSGQTATECEEDFILASFWEPAGWKNRLVFLFLHLWSEYMQASYTQN